MSDGYNWDLARVAEVLEERNEIDRARLLLEFVRHFANTATESGKAAYDAMGKALAREFEKATRYD